MKRKIKIGRSAKTGKFVSEEEVKNNPDTTIIDTIEKKVKHEVKEDKADRYERL